MRVLVAGWVGSTNLGDELVLAGLRRMLAQRGHRVAAISVNPGRTNADHAIAAIDHRRLDRLVSAARAADLVIWGGGGLVQDETSPLNLPYHLSRAWLAELGRTPWVALGIGAGPLTGRLGRRLATTLRSAQAVTVRDEPSQALLAEIGVDARLTADLALHLGPIPTPPVRNGDDASRRVITVALRPWTGRTDRLGRMLPVAWRTDTAATPAWFVPTVAAALDRLAVATDATLRLIALQSDRDHTLHAEVAAAMRTPVATIAPPLAGVLDELARGEVVVAMRYHAGIAATLAGRPVALVGYSPKVDALAAELGTGAAHLGFDRDELEALDTTVADLLERREQAAATVVAGRTRLLARAQGNLDVLDDIEAAVEAAIEAAHGERAAP